MNIPRRKFLIAVARATVLACLLCIAFGPGAQAESEKLTVRVMTRNMDAGTDLNFVTAPGADLPTAIANTLLEVYQSDLPARAAQLAAEIVPVKPDLIALQEVTQWTLPTPAGPVLFDQLELLQSALEANGLHYRVAVTQTLTDINLQAFGVRFTDHNAILVRSDLPPGHLDIIGTETHTYEYHLPDFVTPIGTFTIPNGWMAVDVKIRGARLKFANTHLLSAVPKSVSPTAFNLTSGLQMLQAGELLEGLSKTGLPVLLAGDFNSDAEYPQNEPDSTPTAGIISSSGYTDAWHFLNSGDTGYTWPLFFEDPTAPNPDGPFERIDLIFSRGPIPLSVERTGTGLGTGGVYASDHVGVAATFDLENHRPDVPIRKR